MAPRTTNYFSDQRKLTIQVNGINYDLEAGHTIFINKSVLHIVTYLNQEGEYVSFNFPEKLLAFYSESAMEKKYVLPYTNSFLLSLEIKGDKDWHNQILQILWDMKKNLNRKNGMGVRSFYQNCPVMVNPYIKFFSIL